MAARTSASDVFGVPLGEQVDNPPMPFSPKCFPASAAPNSFPASDRVCTSTRCENAYKRGRSRHRCQLVTNGETCSAATQLLSKFAG